ncbi:MAG: ABC-F family ATP-binding cassette domain-containing protein [Bdellovibrionales bacterium]|nr:ABC-F family ATP-binding cassette domain-containing protein [Bdellovibrionales bacterium]
MALLINARQLKKSYGARLLFEGLSFSLEHSSDKPCRVGLIGPNGAGKSTLLRILAGKENQDEGELTFAKGLRTGHLEQDPKFGLNDTIFSAVMQGTAAASLEDPDHAVRQALSRFELTSDGRTEDTRVSELSGGWQKRVALAREWVKRPDLLLLDEPTNHLDIESILWLEKFLEDSRIALLTITHDRAFLDRIATRILEVDRAHVGGILNVDGGYATYLTTKESVVAVSRENQIRMTNTLRRETEWLRRGAKARTTKQKARIDRAYALEDDLQEIKERNKKSTVRIEFQEGEKNPKKLQEWKKVSKKYGTRTVVPETDLLITPQSRIGLIGANGSGKSTFLKLLGGVLSPDQGTIQSSKDLEISYFEQNRDSLDPDLTVQETILPGGEFVEFQGTRIHVKSYLDRFLFPHSMHPMKVGKLSGGEQNRLLIARLMLKKANLLILDEPTNDLDLETLTVLQDAISDFPGAVVLVSHDRFFLDTCSRQLLAFGRDANGDTEITRLVGLDQWEEWVELNQARTQAAQKKSVAQAAAPTAEPLKRKKLGYMAQRELDGMEQKISDQETLVLKLTEKLEDPKIMASSVKLQEVSAELTKAQAEVERLYARWQELEAGDS